MCGTETLDPEQKVYRCKSIWIRVDGALELIEVACFFKLAADQVLVFGGDVGSTFD